MKRLLGLRAGNQVGITAGTLDDKEVEWVPGARGLYRPCVPKDECQASESQGLRSGDVRTTGNHPKRAAAFDTSGGKRHRRFRAESVVPPRIRLQGH